MDAAEEQARLETVGDQLRGKISSKVSASTFLAGFAFAILSGQIFALWQVERVPPLSSLSTGLLFGSVFLFISGIMRLDELTMPKQFWAEKADAERPLLLSGGYLTLGDLVALQKRMVFYWQWLILVAIGFAAVAVLVLLLPIGAYTLAGPDL
jgi:hypothetical protein